MGVYSDYINNGAFQDFNTLSTERKKQLARISKLRGDRDVLVFAADMNSGKPLPPGLTAISYSDILPITDQISNLNGTYLDLILETPGGFAEVTEEIVHLIRNKYQGFAVIVPGWAKSAGTIFAMAADEILMGPASALGPIDAQLFWQGKQFSADALLEGLEKIKREVQTTGGLNKAYIPILQNLSPGELQDAENALRFATELVTDWLAQHKFRGWTQHASTGLPVTDDERKQRARNVADQLCDHQRWRTHNRSLRIGDLEAMRVEIVDFSKQPELNDAITRYYSLLQMTLATNIYKLYETTSSQIFRAVNIAEQQAPPVGGGQAMVNFLCPKCKTMTPIQANLGRVQPVQPGKVPFPADNHFRCPKCATMHDITQIRRQLEAQSGQPVV